MGWSVRSASAYILGACLAASGLAACVGGDCYGGIGATVTSPVLPVRGGHFVGACPRWVDIGGDNLTQSSKEIDLPAADLEPIGEARRVALATTALATRTVYAIDGVDAAEVVALESWQGEMIVFTRDMGGSDVPVELCDRLADGSAIPPVCQ